MKRKGVTGHLEEKKGYFYMIVNLTNEKGKSYPKWIRTGLKVKGNKTKAEAMLRETLQDYSNRESLKKGEGSDMLFSDFIRGWVDEAVKTVEFTTAASYRTNVTRVIAPYFDETRITLGALDAKDLSDFYKYAMDVRHIKAATAKRYHANIRKALQQAFISKLVPSNVADLVELPKAQEFTTSWYNVDQLNDLFPFLQGEQIELAVLVTAFYGFRRSETLGLKWNAIDFTNETISVRHTVTQAKDENDVLVIVKKDRGKNKASLRTLPLIPQIGDLLKKRLTEQKMYQKVCGRSYSQEYLGYIFVDELGNLLKPDSVSNRFKLILQKNNLPRIRFHDLRHSCASLLIASGVSMKEVQEWVGHSSFNTTANIYGHLDYTSKKNSAVKVGDLLKIKDAQR